MTPSTTVSDIAHDRLVAKSNVQAAYGQSSPGRGTDDMPAPRMPQTVAMENTETLLSAERLQSVRKANSDAQLRSNFWYDISRLAFWATTSLTLLSVMTLSGAGFLAGTTPLFPILGAVIAGGVLMASSQFSKRLVTDRWFDVQDFQQQRQAALIGKSVEQAMAAEKETGAKSNWQQRVSAENAAQTDQQVSR